MARFLGFGPGIKAISNPWRRPRRNHYESFRSTADAIWGSEDFCRWRCGLENEASIAALPSEWESSVHFSIVFRDQDAFEPFVFMSGHLHHEVVAVNEQSYISFHMHKQCKIADSLDEAMFFQDLRLMRLPTSTGVHCAIHPISQQANVLQIVSVPTCEPLFLLMGEFHKHPSHLYSMEVRTADVVHCKGSLAFRLFLTVGSDFCMAFLICLMTRLQFGRPASP